MVGRHARGAGAVDERTGPAHGLARLVVERSSPKTIEHHLGSVFRKRGSSPGLHASHRPCRPGTSSSNQRIGVISSRSPGWDEPVDVPAWLAAFEMMLTSFPDLTLTAQHLAVGNELVIVEARLTGTNSGPFYSGTSIGSCWARMLPACRPQVVPSTSPGPWCSKPLMAWWPPNALLEDGRLPHPARAGREQTPGSQLADAGSGVG